MNISDATPFDSGTLRVIKFWTDSEGNVLYQVYSEQGVEKDQALYKISESGKVLESVSGVR